jgi:hypothetical protein
LKTKSSRKTLVPDIHKFLDIISPIDLNLYSKESQANLVTYAISLLEDNEIISSLPNVTVLSHKLFPEKFSMLGFNEHPDGYRIQNSVRRDAYKAGLLSGNMKTYWKTTIQGKAVVNLLQRNFNQLNNKTQTSKQNSLNRTNNIKSPAPRNETEKIINRFLNSKLYSKLLSSNSTNRNTLTLGLQSPYFSSKEKIHKKLLELIQAAELVKQDISNTKNIQKANTALIILNTLKDKWQTIEDQLFTNSNTEKEISNLLSAKNIEKLTNSKRGMI